MNSLALLFFVIFQSRNDFGFLFVWLVVKVISTTEELFLLCNMRLSARINGKMLVDGIYAGGGESKGSFNILCEKLCFKCGKE